MKNAFNRLQERRRAWWYLVQARVAIARCNRNVAPRRRIGVPVQRRPRGPYFAPGIIDYPESRGSRAGMRAYAVTLAIAAVSVFYMVLTGGPAA